MGNQDTFVAIGLLTQRDLDILGSSFQSAFPVSRNGASFDELLRAIDRAERENDAVQERFRRPARS